MSPLRRIRSLNTGSAENAMKQLAIAVLTRHDLSLLGPGDRTHTFERIAAVAKEAPVILLMPYGHAPRKLEPLMTVVQVCPPGLRFLLALVPTLLAHRRDYKCVYSRDPLLIAAAVPLKILGKVLVLELNGIPSLQARVRRGPIRTRVPALTPIMCSVLRLIEILAIRSADLILPITEKMRRLVLSDYRADVRKVTVIANGVDTTLFRPLETQRVKIRRRLGIGEETVVLFFGMFSASWRHTGQLLEVAEHIQFRRKDIIFLIIGAGPLLRKRKEKATELGAGNRMIFLGAVDYRLVPLYINAADVYVYDATPEAYQLIQREGPCPMKILESMSCGKPVIVPKEAQLENILQNSGGGFAASSVAEIEALVEKFADAKELAKSMGINARRYIELNHDLAPLARRTIELIDEVISSGRG